MNAVQSKTMSSRQIAEVVGSRHDSVRRTAPRPNLTWVINPLISFPCTYRLVSRNL
jgi:phage regulator Rha-like protein